MANPTTLEAFQRLFPDKYHLFYPAPSNVGAQRQCDLFIRIMSGPASRLFAGTKTFELRKYVPKHTGWVFLFETDQTQAVTGAFHFTSFLTKPVPELWRIVGDRATSKERFASYFADKTFGVALEVDQVRRPTQSISKEELYSRFPELPPPPEPYVYLYTEVGSTFSQFLRSRFVALNTPPPNARR